MSNDDSSKKREPVRIINPPNQIKQKISGSGGPSQEMLAKAQAAIERMSSDYPNWAANDVETLSALVDKIKPGDSTKGEAVNEAFRMAHDMRGQGGSFGYPLMTRISNSFCRFTEKMETVDQGAIDILKTHVNAMRAVIGHRVSGDGGTTGTQIADGLEKAVQKYLTKAGLA